MRRLRQWMRAPGRQAPKLFPRQRGAEDVIAQATAEEVEALGTDELIMGTEPPEGEAIVDLADAKSKDDFEVLEEAQLQKEIESEEV